jgi:hypothetical protein
MGKSITEYTEDLRIAYQDIAAKNRLLRFQTEFSNNEHRKALDKALSKYNTTAPMEISASFVSFPSDSILIDLALCELCKMSGFYSTRNSLQYSDNGLTIADVEKSGQYMNWVNMLCKQASQDAKDLKRSINLANAISNTSANLSSEYAIYRRRPYDENI